MLPPPDTIPHVPPDGIASNIFLSVSQMVAWLVVLAGIKLSLTIKLVSLVVAIQAPLAAT